MREKAIMAKGIFSSSGWTRFTALLGTMTGIIGFWREFHSGDSIKIINL